MSKNVSIDHVKGISNQGLPLFESARVPKLLEWESVACRQLLHDWADYKVKWESSSTSSQRLISFKLCFSRELLGAIVDYGAVVDDSQSSDSSLESSADSSSEEDSDMKKRKRNQPVRLTVETITENQLMELVIKKAGWIKDPVRGERLLKEELAKKLKMKMTVNARDRVQMLFMDFSMILTRMGMSDFKHTQPKKCSEYILKALEPYELGFMVRTALQSCAKKKLKNDLHKLRKEITKSAVILDDCIAVINSVKNGEWPDKDVPPGILLKRKAAALSKEHNSGSSSKHHKPALEVQRSSGVKCFTCQGDHLVKDCPRNQKRDSWKGKPKIRRTRRRSQRRSTPSKGRQKEKSSGSQ